MSVQGLEDDHNDKSDAQQETSASPLDPRPGPVRFKASKEGSKRRRVSIEDGLDQDSVESSQHRHSRHRRHQHSSRHKKDGHSETQPQTLEPDELDPDSAFRESLFDAMADDEGADFWQGVYGLPIHQYSNARQAPDGELERMDDEEYVAYVRARMWEKSHEHILEERRLREEAAGKREAEKKESARLRADAKRFDRDMEESLRRGEQRRAMKSWKTAWEQYEKGWTMFLEATSSKSPIVDEAAGIPWPVKSGKREDVSTDEVEGFMRNSGDTGKDLAIRLKAERVRYHPDKVQQRMGQKRMLERDVKTVTKTFQIIDELYTRMKK